MSALPITVYTGGVPAEGPKVIPLALDFSVQGSFEFDIQMQLSLAQISCIQSIYVDNYDSAAPLVIELPSTQQRIVVPAGNQGFWPVLADLNGTIIFSSADTIPCRVHLMNFSSAQANWPEGGGGAGTVTGAANIGAGAGIYRDLTGGILNFYSLLAGANITLTPGPGGITIAATGGGGGGVPEIPATNQYFVRTYDGVNYSWHSISNDGGLGVDNAVIDFTASAAIRLGDGSGTPTVAAQMTAAGIYFVGKMTIAPGADQVTFYSSGFSQLAQFTENAASIRKLVLPITDILSSGNIDDAGGNSTYFVDATGGNIASVIQNMGFGTILTFKLRAVSGGNTFTLTDFLGATFDGAASLVLSTQYESVTIQKYSNSEWAIIAKI